MEDSPRRTHTTGSALHRPGLAGDAVAASDRTTTAWSHALILVPLAFSAWVYLPITRVYFWADDFVNLTDLVARDRLDFLLRPGGGHNLLIWRAVCLIAYALFGFRAEPHYWLILATHLLNVALLFVVVRSLTGSALLGCLGATLWGTSPLAAGTLGWYSVYGQVLAAFLLLVVLAQVTHRGAAAGPPSARAAWGWSGCMLLASLCFGIGIGMALVFPAVLFLLRPNAWNRQVWVASFVLPPATVALYLGLRHLYFSMAPMPLWDELQFALARASLGGVPRVLAEMLGFSVAASVRGFAMAPGTYPDVASMATVAGFAVAVALALVYGEPDLRRAMLAMLVLALGMYAVIAVARASYYVIWHLDPGVIVTWTRYHYAGTIPIVVLLCLVAEQAARLSHRAAAVRAFALAAATVVGVVGFARSGFAIEDHQAARMSVTTALAQIRADVIAQPPGTTVYLENGVLPFTLTGPMINQEMLPGRAALFVLVAPSGILGGRSVRFIEPDPKVLAYDDRAPKLGALLVPREAATPGPAVVHAP